MTTRYLVQARQFGAIESETTTDTLDQAETWIARHAAAWGVLEADWMLAHPRIVLMRRVYDAPHTDAAYEIEFLQGADGD